MPKPALFQNLVYYVLLFATFLGSATWSVFWLMFRVPVADWRYLAVGMLLAAVLGWWPVVSVVVAMVLALAVGVFARDFDSNSKIQVIQEIAIFWALGLGWGALAKRWLSTPPTRRVKPTTNVPRASTGHPAGATSGLRSAESNAFRSTRLMSGSFEETIRTPLQPALVAKPPEEDDLGPREFPVFKEPPKQTGPMPRPVLPPPPSYFGGESVYTPSLPGTSDEESAHFTLDAGTPPPPEPPPGLGVKFSSLHLHQGGPHPLAPPSSKLENNPPRPPALDDPSVMPAEELPTMELPVNTLLRANSNSSSQSNSSMHVSIPSQGSSAGSSSDNSDSDPQSVRRSLIVQRPETAPGEPYEHLLEWFNQFSWSPWTADELQRRYFLPGTHVGWENLALADLAKAWKVWSAGLVAMPTSVGQVSLGALEGFLRCEVLGVLRQKGFSDLHLLSTSTTGDAWVSVYHEVRGRLRGGEAIIHRVDQGELATDAKGILVGRPDRLAEIRRESDVVTLVTPYSVGESLNWTPVYAVAQQRVAESMGWALSGVPVVINLPLPIWDERRISRVVVVDDVATEQRRLDVALERFNKILSGLLPAKPQAQSSVCNGCGWRHHCPSYGGTRSRLDLADPPAQIAAALK